MTKKKMMKKKKPGKTTGKYQPVSKGHRHRPVTPTSSLFISIHGWPFLLLPSLSHV
ncbi:hypothetical protein Peur_000885 [Populus x canadensis]